MKNISLVFVVLLFTSISCNDDSIVEPILKLNYITLSGDITATFETHTLAAVFTNPPFGFDSLKSDSTSTFMITIRPKSSFNSGEEFEVKNTLSFMKFNSGILEAGVYNLDDKANSEIDYMCAFFVDDTTFYSINSGSIEITASGANIIAGNFNVTGYYLGFPIDSTRILHINAKFSTILEEL